MYVFSYDPQTLAYTGGTPADYDQKEPGTVLVPAFASRNPPPKFDSSHQWPFYIPEADAWEVREVVRVSAPEPEPEPVPELERNEQLRVSIQQHLEAAQRLMAELDGGPADVG